MALKAKDGNFLKQYPNVERYVYEGLNPFIEQNKGSYVAIDDVTGFLWNIIKNNKQFIIPEMYDKFIMSSILDYKKAISNNYQKQNKQINQFLEKSDLLVFGLLSMKVKDDEDNILVNHSKRTGVYAYNICMGMGLSKENTESYTIGTELHDIGKIRTPNRILKSNLNLENAEWWIMKEHPSDGVEILEHMASLMGLEIDSIKDIIYNHHERWEGLGYPNNKSGEEIPLGARIAAIADGFDALTSKRPYRDALSVPDALNIMDKDGRYDPNALKIAKPILEKTYQHIQKQRLA